MSASDDFTDQLMGLKPTKAQWRKLKQPKPEVDTYTITVRRIGTPERVYREHYQGTRQEVENRASHVWSNERFDTEPDIFRLSVHQRGHKKAILIIG